MNTATLPAARHDGIGVFEGDPGLGWAARLREALAASDAPTLLIVAQGTMPDAFTIGQMAEALEALADVDAVSPVSIREVIDAWDLTDDVDAVLEAWTWAPHVALPARPDPRCALWTRAAARRIVDGGDASAVSARRLPHLAAALGLERAIASPEDVGIIDPDWRPGRLALRRSPPTRAGRHSQPVILHVLHNWGGGVSRFVADQMRDDPDALHLALVSSGDRRRGFGQRVALHVDLDACPIRQWACDPPVGDMAESHPAVHAALSHALDSFGVSALRVSSLIGTTLDVLRTGLPTAFVVHDLFPFWPDLGDVEA
ncbi:MAG: hypothetical protein ACRC2H_04550, partial [Silanimonas sp.]